MEMDEQVRGLMEEAQAKKIESKKDFIEKTEDQNNLIIKLTD